MDITQRPKGPSKSIRDIKKPKYNPVITLKTYLTDDAAKSWRLSYLKNLANGTGSRKWQDYFKFVCENLSGDINSFKDDDKKKIEEIIAELEKKKTQDAQGL